MKWTLRKAVPSDLDFAREVSKENLGEFIDRHLGGWDPEKFNEGFRPEEDEIIEVKGEPVGFLSVTERDGRLYVGNLQVQSDFQKKGIGRELMADLEIRAVREGMTAVEFNVFIDNPALEFYRKLGYSEVFESGPLIRMRKELQRSGTSVSSEQNYRLTNRESQ